VRFLIVVRRDRVRAFHSLREAFAPESVTVILDRRFAERRRSVEEVGGERRRVERRAAPLPSWGTWGVVVTDLERRQPRPG
jgi:hypothetical protein